MAGVTGVTIKTGGVEQGGPSVAASPRQLSPEQLIPPPSVKAVPPRHVDVQAGWVVGQDGLSTSQFVIKVMNENRPLVVADFDPTGRATDMVSAIQAGIGYEVLRGVMDESQMAIVNEAFGAMPADVKHKLAQEQAEAQRIQELETWAQNSHIKPKAHGLSRVVSFAQSLFPPKGE